MAVPKQTLDIYIFNVTMVKVRKFDSGIARRSTTPEKIETVAIIKIYFRTSWTSKFYPPSLVYIHN